MTVMFCDFETRSAADLKEVGLHNYARHPTTDVWCMAWAIGEEEPVLWHPGSPVIETDRFRDFVRNGGRVVAHNAPFELEIWNRIMVPRYGWPRLSPEQCECTMSTGYAMSLPGALEDVALALGLKMLKDAEGRALMLRMARPRSKAGVTPIVWWDEPEKLQRLYEYCKQDVRVEREVYSRLVPLSATERRVWLADYAINHRGVHIDRPSVDGASRAVSKLVEEYNERMSRITGGEVSSVGSLIAMKEWCAARGTPVESLAKMELAELLDSDAVIAPEVREVLTLRQEAGKASTAKLDVMLAVAGEDDRMRGLYQYHGAGPGRWAGRKVQPHNLTRDVPEDPAEVEHVLELFRRGEVRAIDMIYGPPMTMLSRCLRPLFTPAPGHVLVGGDWSNVEGRGVAWIAGEEWKLQAFRAFDRGEGPDLYRVAYGRAFGVEPSTVGKADRQKGKVMELAFGYQGGVGAVRTMGRTVGVKVDDRTANDWKLRWRAAHPRVKALWYELQRAAIAAVRSPGETHEAGHPGRRAKYKVVGSFLWCLLPSNRAICYPYPKILDGTYGPMLTYMTVPSLEDRKKGRVIFDPVNTSTWARVSTYGGSLLENIVQAFCRDFLAGLILQCEEAGYPVVLHTHDDCYTEVLRAQAEAARAWMQRAMNTAPPWASAFPLAAEVSITERYGL